MTIRASAPWNASHVGRLGVNGRRSASITPAMTHSGGGQYDTYDGPLMMPEDPNGQAMPPISGAWGVWAYGDHILVGDTVRGLIVLDYIP